MSPAKSYEIDGEPLHGLRYGGKVNVRCAGGSSERLYTLYVDHPNGPWGAIFCKTERQATAIAALAQQKEKKWTAFPRAKR